MKKTADGTESNFEVIKATCFRLLPAQVLLAAIGAINGIFSSLFASNFVGAYAMSAVGLYNPVRLLIGAVSTMMLGGSQILIGKYMGKNQRSEMQNIFSINIIVSILFSLVMMALLIGGVAFQLSGIFTSDQQVLVYFDQYLIGSALGILPYILGQQLSGFLSLENQGKRTLTASIACIISTVSMNYLFLGVFHWEAFGLAMASSVGMWVFFFVEALYYIKGKSEFKLGIKNIKWKQSKDIIVTGLPGALGSGYMTIRSLVVNSLLMTYAGSIGLSAFATSNAFLDIFWAVPAGMCAVSRMLISVSTGEEDRTSLQDIMRVVLFRFLPVMIGIAALIIACAVPFTHLYYQNPADPVFAMTVSGLRILPLCMPLSLICMHFVCYGQTSGKQVLIHILSVVDGVLAVVFFSTLLTPALGINGVYIANVLNGIATVVIVILYSWIRNKKFPKTMEQLMVIPDDFGVSKDSRMDLSVDTLEEVVSISKRVQSFCIGKGIDERRAYFAALAIEEMAGNVVEHGFVKDRKAHSIDLRVVCKENTVILRIKDDCRPFNPADRKTVMNPEDPTKNIGIRMIYAICKDIKYQNILGMNAVTIKI